MLSVDARIGAALRGTGGLGPARFFVPERMPQ